MCIPPSTIAGAGKHLFNTCLRCTSYRGCRPTHRVPVQCWTSVAAHCWFNADVNCLRRWPNNNPSRGLLYTLRKHVAFTQCCFNVDQPSSTLSRHWNSIGWLYVFSYSYITLVTLYIPAPETPDNTMQWPNADVMLGHHLQRWTNIIPANTL